jgi:hypothetical protein
VEFELMASHLLDMCCTIGDTLPALVSFLKERRLRNYPYDFVTNAIIPIREECQLRRVPAAFW